MNYQKYLEFVASFLIVLVLTLPFYTTSVYAGINSISARGSTGVDNYVKKSDFVDFKVQVSSDDGSAVAPNQLRIGPTIYFTQCTALPNSGYECAGKWPSTGTYLFGSGPMQYTIFLLNPDNSIKQQQSGSVFADYEIPVIASATTPQNVYGANANGQIEIEINYDITDYACGSECSNRCSGIKKIEFLRDDARTVLAAIEPSNDNCNAKGKAAISTTFTDGEHSIYVRATDKFDQVSADKSVQFQVDSTPPSVLSNSLSINKNGVELNSFSSRPVPVIVSINITSSDLNVNSVKANVFDLNPDDNSLKDITLACRSIGTSKFTCERAVTLNPDPGGSSSSKTVNLRFNASDAVGNKVSVPLARTLTRDDNGPVVSDLTTGFKSGEQIFGKLSGNKVTAVFDEATGISANEVILYVNDNRANSAKNCTKQGSKWVCIWDDISFASPSSAISIKTDTTDFLLNPVAQEKTVNVIIDTQVPALSGNVNVQPIGGSIAAIPGIFKVGDRLFVEANATDNNPVTATADFSSFITGASRVVGSCSFVDNKYKCTWTTTEPIGIAASSNIRITFTDAAGNQLPVNAPLTVLGLDGRPAPDFWKHTFKCSPQFLLAGGNASIDRSTANLINQRAYCLITLSKNNQNDDVSTVAVFQPENCVTEDGLKDLFASTEIINSQANSVNPVLRIEFNKKGNYDIDDAPLQCPIAILSKIKQADGTYRITQNQEIENVKINITFYNLPLGELSQGIKDKIHHAKKRALDDMKVIGTLNNLVTIAKRICQLINVFYTVVSILHTLHISFGLLSQACTLLGGDAIGVCEPIDTTSRQMCKPADKLNDETDRTKNRVNKFCDFVTCKQAPLWGDNVQRWINNLPLAGYVGQTTEEREIAQSASNNNQPNDKQYDYVKNRFLGARQLSDYMNPNDNLIVATLFACLPGIVGNLEKYRQIQCMYADCLENGVGKEGLPAAACEDEKHYATCKYLTGEAFALIPWVAVFDHFTGIIKEALSNPFTVLGVAASLSCGNTCNVPRDGRASYIFCRGVRGAGQFLSAFGDAAQNVALLSNEGFKVKNDYCSRISLDEEAVEENAEPTQRNI